MRMRQALILVAALWAIACRPSPGEHQTKPKPSMAMAMVSSAFTVPAWYIDGSNTTGCASDGNTCQSATCGGIGVGPCSTYASIINRWGTASPTIAQSTRVTFLSNDNEPPFYVTPAVTAAGSFFMTGTLSTVGSGTLSSATQRNRATGQLLSVNLGQSVAPFVGLILKDVTKSVYAWIDSSSSGTTAVLSQPFTSTAECIFVSSESDTVTGGDTFQIIQPSQVNVRSFNPALPINTLVPSIQSCFENIWVPDLSGTPSTSSFDFNATTQATLSRIDPTAYFRSEKVSLEAVYNFNDNWNGGAQASATASLNSANLIGGILYASESYSDQGSSNGMYILDGGIILHGFVLMTGGALGDVYVKSFLDLVKEFIQIGQNVGPGVIWGPGELQVGPGVVLTMRTGLTATQAFQQTGGFFFGNFSNIGTACGIDVTGDPAVWHCGRTLTPAHIDGTIASGGFGGSAVDPWLGSTITAER